MSAESILTTELSSAYQRALATSFTTGAVGLLDALDHPIRDVCVSAAFKLHDLAEKLNEVVELDGRFPQGKRLLLQTDGGCVGFYPHDVGRPLIRRALEAHSPQAGVDWLQKVLAATSATGQTVHTLWGAQVAGEFEIAPSVKIVPLDAIPDGPQKRAILDVRHGVGAPIFSGLHFQRPTSALVVRREISPLIIDQDDIRGPHPQDGEFTRIHTLLQEITLAITIVGPRVSLSAAQWFTFDDPDIELANLMSGSRRSQFIEILPIRSRDEPLLDPSEAKEIVQKYLALPDKTRDRVRVAIRRISQALRRHEVGDRAVELSTAFEALLGDDATTEMTHKIKVRSVRLAGGNAAARNRNASVMSKAYSIRSALVHTGRVDTSKTYTIDGEKMTASDIVDEAIRLCVETTKTVIRNGCIPDWAVFDVSN